MNLKENLDIKRLWHLIRYDFRVNKWAYILIVPVFVLVLSLTLMNMFSGHFVPDHRAYYPFLFMGYFITGILIGGNSFPGFKTKERAIHYLTIPASTLEKYLVQWIFRILLFLVLYPLLFKFTTNLSIEVFLNLKKIYLESKGLGDTKLPEIPRFYFRDIIQGMQFKESWSLMAFIFFWISGISLMFLGGTIFSRWNMIKTPFAILAMFLVYFLYLVLLSHILNPDTTEGLQITVRPVGPKWIDDLELVQSVMYLFIYLLPPIAWVAAYFKLKEKEV